MNKITIKQAGLFFALFRTRIFCFSIGFYGWRSVIRSCLRFFVRMFCRARNKRLQIFFKIPERKLFLTVPCGLIFRFGNKAAGLDIDIIQCLVLFCFIGHALFFKLRVDVALDQRIKTAKIGTPRIMPGTPMRPLKMVMEKNNPEPGKTGGIAKNLRPKGSCRQTAAKSR